MTELMKKGSDNPVAHSAITVFLQQKFPMLPVFQDIYLPFHPIENAYKIIRNLSMTRLLNKT